MGNIQKIKPSGIFTNYIFKSIPLAFDESLSYYETLCGILDLLKTQEEVVNHNADLLAELESYVKNYFDNLDVQEEINNKLDEMAEDGTLENLISQYIELMTIYTYNNINEMKNATNLVNGSFTRTYGFYSYNDGGGAYYKVRQITNDDIVDEMTIIALNDNTLIAELIKVKEMSVKMFGAKGDNTTDDTLPIQKALNYCNNIVINDGTYKINIYPGLIVNDNTVINLDNANIEGINSSYGTSPNDITSIFKLENIDNVIINGNNNYLKGDRINHENTTDQFGFGILINNSNNICIKNIILKDNTGDGINLIGGNSTNILIDNVVCDNNHRQGISVCSGENIKIINSTFKNTNGTSPQDGIDIEPYGSLYVKDIIIDNCYFYNNSGWGIECSFTGTAIKPISNVKITNNTFDTNTTGDINIKNKIDDNLQIINNNFINSSIGIRIANCQLGTINNNIVNGANSYGVMLVKSQNLIFTNNSIINGNTFGVNLNSTSKTLFDNNILAYNVGSGLMFYNSDNNSEYNTFSNNKIHDNGATNYDNIEINGKTNNNVFKGNDTTGTSYSYKYDINFAEANSSGNIICNNILHAGITGSLYLRSNSTLDNIIDGVYDAGNLHI